MNRILYSTSLIAFSLFLCSHASGEDWTRFRGDNGQGISNEKNIPTKFGESDYQFKVKLKGSGNSSPVILGEKLFLMSADKDTATRYLVCLNSKTGKEIWTKEYESQAHRLHSRNSFASCTPAVDKDHVYFAWSTPKETLIKALDHDGNEVWSKDLGPWVSQHGFGTSPIVYKDKLILSNSQQGERLKPGQKAGVSSVVAFDRKTGKIEWKTDRGSAAASYSVPCIYKGKDGKDQLIGCSTADGMYSLDPETGKELWSFAGAFKMRTVASPTISDGLILGSTGSGGGGNYVIAIQPPTERAAKANEKFRVTKNASYVPCPIVHGGNIFIWYDKGILSCADGKTGEVKWRERMDSGFSGSPILVEDRMYCIGEDGTLYVVRASDKFESMAKIDLGESARSTPAVANGMLYLRTDSHLIAVGG